MLQHPMSLAPYALSLEPNHQMEDVVVDKRL